VGWEERDVVTDAKRETLCNAGREGGRNVLKRTGCGGRARHLPPPYLDENKKVEGRKKKSTKY
jgi:hypothetical protein